MQRVCYLIGISVLPFCQPCTAGLSIATCCSGVTVSGNYSATLGNMNGLALGTPTSGVSTYATGNGQLYSSPMNVSVSTNGGLLASQVELSVKIYTNFSHSAALDAYWCTSTCSSGGTLITTSSSVIGDYTPGLFGQTVQIAFGVNVHNINGASAFTGADSVVLSLLCQDTNGLLGINGSTTVYLTLNLTVQNALQFTLSTSGSGINISPASDYSAAWGNINGLGVGTPTSGLTANSVSGGFVYETPINLLPVYCSFSSSTGTLSVYVSSNFVHTALLGMRDSSAPSGPYTNISTTSASPTTLTTTAASSSTITRYLGIFVSNQNGGSAFSGADNATLTYQMTVP